MGHSSCIYAVIVITGKCTQEPRQYMYAVFWEHWYCTQWPPFCMCSLHWKHRNCTQWPTHCMCLVCQEHWTQIFTLAMWIIYQFQCWLNGFAKRYSTIFHPTGKQHCGGVVCIELRSLASQGLVNKIGRSVAIAIRLQNLKRNKDYFNWKQSAFAHMQTPLDFPKSPLVWLWIGLCSLLSILGCGEWRFSFPIKWI